MPFLAAIQAGAAPAEWVWADTPGAESAYCVYSTEWDEAWQDAAGGDGAAGAGRDTATDTKVRASCLQKFAAAGCADTLSGGGLGSCLVCAAAHYGESPCSDDMVDEFCSGGGHRRRG